MHILQLDFPRIQHRLRGAHCFRRLSLVSPALERTHGVPIQSLDGTPFGERRPVRRRGMSQVSPLAREAEHAAIVCLTRIVPFGNIPNSAGEPMDGLTLFSVEWPHFAVV